MSSRRRGARAAGIARSAGALAMMLVGAAPRAVLAQPPPSYLQHPAYTPLPRRNPEMMATGIVITTIATITLAAGIGGMFAARASGGDSTGALWLSIIAPPASFVLAGVGVPLWVAGALPKCTPPLLVSPAPSNPTLRNVGIAMTSVAAAGLAVGISGWVAAARDDFHSQGPVWVGGLATGTSIVLSSVGVPLWVMGAHPKCTSLSDALVPEITVGPTTTLRWTF